MRHVWIAMGLVLSAAATAGAAVEYDSTRYAVILARKPFGEVKAPPPAPAVVPAVPTKPAEPPFTKDLRMCAVTEMDGQLRVGFVSLAQKPPKNYYLAVGQSEDGIMVVDADYEGEAALLAKNGQEYWIYMDGRTEAAAGPGPAGPAGASGPGPGFNPFRDLTKKSYRARLIARREAKEKALSREEYEKQVAEGERPAPKSPVKPATLRTAAPISSPRRGVPNRGEPAPPGATSSPRALAPPSEP